MRFHTTILGTGKTAAGIEVPTEVVEALGPSKKPAVRVTIGDFTYRSTVATINGVFMIGVSNDVRKSSGLAVGDEVDVDLEIDTAPREISVPPDLAAAARRRTRCATRVRRTVVQQQAGDRGADRWRQGARDPPATDRQGARVAARAGEPSRPDRGRQTPVGAAVGRGRVG